MRKWLFITLAVILFLSAAYMVAVQRFSSAPQSPPPTADHPKNVDVAVTSPALGSSITSPVRVEGFAPGSWYFEASFPITVTDAKGIPLGKAPAQAQGEWMTTSSVPFVAIIPFSKPLTRTGFLRLERDNPSGLPQFDESRSFPIQFSQDARSIQLFYYRPEQDLDKQGNPMCSRTGLVAVNRTLPTSITPIQDAIRLLLRGDLTAEEKNQGLTTEFPLPEFDMTGANLRDGLLTISFEDPQHKTSGGACRTALLWLQIKTTALQFPEVHAVNFRPEDLFQP